MLTDGTAGRTPGTRAAAPSSAPPATGSRCRSGPASARDRRRLAAACPPAGPTRPDRSPAQRQQHRVSKPLQSAERAGLSHQKSATMPPFRLVAHLILTNEAAKASHDAAEGLQAVASAAALTFGRFASSTSLSFASSNAASASRSCLSSVCSTIVPPRVLAVTQPPAGTDERSSVEKVDTAVRKL